METPKVSIGVSGGSVNIKVSVANEGTEIATNETKIALIALLEAITKATPTDLDDKALPFAKMLVQLIESKQA
jgi:hypothetical protein